MRFTNSLPEPRRNPAEFLTLRIFVGIDLAQYENGAPVEASWCAPMSETGQSRHFDPAPLTSGLPLRRDIGSTGRQVSKVPIGDIPRFGYNESGVQATLEVAGMSSSSRRSFLIALISLLSISASAADGISVVLSGATTDHDKRTGNPSLKLIFSEASTQKLRTFSTKNVGQKVELRVAGNVILTSVLREPLMGSNMELWDGGWTDQTVIDLAQKLSNAPNGEIELRAVP